MNALITGASSGIGLELAKLFARDEHDVVLVARRADKLKQLAAQLGSAHNIRATVIPADLADPAAPEEIFRALRAADVELDVLVNNAGFGVTGPFLATDAAAELRMIQVNVTALTHLTKLFLPGMLGRGAGRVLNVASTAGFQPGPLMAVYYATKAYVISFSDALAEELRGTGVTVTCLCPGPTKTGFQEAAHMDGVRIFKLPLVRCASPALPPAPRAIAGTPSAIGTLASVDALASSASLPRMRFAAIAACTSGWVRGVTPDGRSPRSWISMPSGGVAGARRRFSSSVARARAARTVTSSCASAFGSSLRRSRSSQAS